MKYNHKHFSITYLKTQGHMIISKQSGVIIAGLAWNKQICAIVVQRTRHKSSEEINQSNRRARY